MKANEKEHNSNVKIIIKRFCVCVYIIWKVRVCVLSIKKTICIFLISQVQFCFSFFLVVLTLFSFFSVFLFPRMPFQLLPQIIFFQLISITFGAVTILVKFRTILIKTYLSFLRKVSNYHISCPVLARVYRYLCIDHHQYLLPTEPS